MERRLLQASILFFGLVPVGAGMAGCVFGVDVFGHGESVGRDIDSHWRYLSGLLFAIGITFWSLTPRIEQEGPRVRLLTALVFVGGLARLYAVSARGWPEWGMRDALVMELLVTPGLALWRERVQRLAKR